MSSKRSPNGAAPTTPTIQDVSRLAGVSTATVSRVLAGKSVVKDETRQRVDEAVRTLNYQVNRNARNLRRSEISKIGVVITDIQNPFFGSVIRGIEKVTIDKDFTIILGNSDEDPEREKRLITMLLEEGVAGIIFAPTDPDCESYQNLLKTAVPFVIIDRKVDQCEADTVTVDGYTGSSAAVERLIELGHTHIAFIGGLRHLSVMQEREKGYMETLDKYGLSVPAGYLRRGDNRQEGGYQAMLELLELDQPPSAVLIANNLMTLGGLKAIHEAGIKIPQQISLIGFDDMDWAPSLQPPLSVVAQPAYEMGEKAALALLKRLQEPGQPPTNVVLKTDLIMRSSVRSLSEFGR